MNTQAPSPSDNKVILMSIILYFVILFFIAHTWIQAKPLKRNDFHEPMLTYIGHTRIMLDKSNILESHQYLNEQKAAVKSILAQMPLDMYLRREYNSDFVAIGHRLR